MGGPQSWLSVDMAGTSAQLGTGSSEDHPHLSLVQAVKELPEQVLKGRGGVGGALHENSPPPPAVAAPAFTATPA